MNWKDELGFALLLAGFETIMEPSCCVACSLRDVMGRRGWVGRGRWYVVAHRELGCVRFVVGGYGGDQGEALERFRGVLAGVGVPAGEVAGVF